MIGEALAFDALKSSGGTLSIGNAKSRTVIATEREFVEVAVKMGFAAMLIDADHAAFEHREHAFDCVRVDIATSIFLGRVLHGLVRRTRGRFPDRAGFRSCLRGGDILFESALTLSGPSGIH